MSSERLYTGPSMKPHDVGVAVAVAVCRNDEVLLLQRQGAAGVGTWGTPGGGLEFGEDPKEAIIRELKEETGLTVLAEHIVELGYTNDTHHDRPLQYITLRFATRTFSGEPRNMEPEKCSDMGWFSIKNLPAPMFPFTAEDLSRPIMRKYISSF